jgi:acetyl esterase/lipase
MKLFSPDVSPLLAKSEDLVGLPKAYMLIVEHDPLRDEQLLFYHRLKEAGVNVDLVISPDGQHAQCKKIKDILNIFQKGISINFKCSA